MVSERMRARMHRPIYVLFFAGDLVGEPAAGLAAAAPDCFAPLPGAPASLGLPNVAVAASRAQNAADGSCMASRACAARRSGLKGRRTQS